MDKESRERIDNMLFAAPPVPMSRMARAAMLGAEIVQIHRNAG